MAYGLERQLLVESGPAIAVAESRPERASTVYRAWRKLSAERRLAAVELRLNAPIDFADGYPLAL